MKINILIPVRALHDGKRRLSPALSATERRALTGWFFTRTVAVARSVLPASDIILVSAAPDLLAYGQEAGLHIVAEAHPGDLNTALRLGAAAARRKGADATLCLSCDLPFLERNDLEAMIATARPGAVTIAPDRSGIGTNAMLTAPIGAIPFLYGQNSFTAHSAAAKAAGLIQTTLRRRGFACDIDLPADLDSIGFMKNDRHIIAAE
ncbi:2-phospho-L-lactate guanylyltransferase [Niveispirillum sp. KHB5.9]|uniref:2-phospho-L-lactate guanylyltransferase n=1 Tax=Niveispirillum sp. KHB5.9 TaxID=3400269 RepID=UPI003A8A3F14